MKYRIWNKTDRQFEPYLLVTQDGSIVNNEYGDLIGYDNYREYVIEYATYYNESHKEWLYEGDIVQYDDGYVGEVVYDDGATYILENGCYNSMDEGCYYKIGTIHDKGE